METTHDTKKPQTDSCHLISDWKLIAHCNQPRNELVYLEKYFISEIKVILFWLWFTYASNKLDFNLSIVSTIFIVHKQTFTLSFGFCRKIAVINVWNKLIYLQPQILKTFSSISFIPTKGWATFLGMLPLSEKIKLCLLHFQLTKNMKM